VVICVLNYFLQGIKVSISNTVCEFVQLRSIHCYVGNDEQGSVINVLLASSTISARLQLSLVPHSTHDIENTMNFMALSL
jgi:hypothetical protein